MRHWALLGGLIAGVVGLGEGALAQTLETYQFSGTVGSHAIEASITVNSGTTYDVGHYFYDSQLKDIPLTGSLAGRTVTLTEPGGGVFHLTLQGSGGAGADGGTFETASGLAGSWTQGAQTLPVKLGLDTAYAGAPNGHLYADVTNASDAAFEAMVRRFLTAALAGDKATAAAAVSYPLAVNGAHKLTVKTRAALIADWNTVFTPALLATLRTAVPHEMFVHEGQAMVAGGAVWFDARGASAINEP
jgi:hypothetical protein